MNKLRTIDCRRCSGTGKIRTLDPRDVSPIAGPVSAGRPIRDSAARIVMVECPDCGGRGRP